MISAKEANRLSNQGLGKSLIEHLDYIEELIVEACENGDKRLYVKRPPERMVAFIIWSLKDAGYEVINGPSFLMIRW